MIRLVVADDHPIVRAGLVALFSLEDDFEVVAAVGRGDQVVDAVLEHRPDVALLDIEMPGLDGISAAAQLRSTSPATRVMMLTVFGRAGYLRSALEAGASGFLLKDTPAHELAAAIRRIAAGHRVVDPQFAVEALADGGNPLTEREREVLQAATQLGTVTEMAERLSLSEGTVRNHLSAAIQKTGARNRAEAARIARDKGWLNPLR
jgi:two-component system response regulator DesR